MLDSIPAVVIVLAVVVVIYGATSIRIVKEWEEVVPPDCLGEAAAIQRSQEC